MYEIVRTSTYESFFYATDIALCYRVFQETPEVDNLIFQLPVKTAFFSKFEIRLFIERFFFCLDISQNQFLTARFTQSSILYGFR